MSRFQRTLKIFAVLLFVYLSVSKIYETVEFEKSFDVVKQLENEETEKTQEYDFLYQNQKSYERLADPDNIEKERDQYPPGLGVSKFEHTSREVKQQDAIPVNIDEIDKIFELGDF